MVIIRDELCYQSIAKEQAIVLFKLVTSRYTKGAIILTSNYGLFKQFSMDRVQEFRHYKVGLALHWIFSTVRSRYEKT